MDINYKGKTIMVGTLCSDDGFTVFVKADDGFAYDTIFETLSDAKKFIDEHYDKCDDYKGIVVYKANVYHSTMTCNTYLNLGTDNDLMDKAHEMFLNLISGESEDFETFDKFCSDNNIKYLDDAAYGLDFGKIKGTDINVVTDSDGNSYLYEVVHGYRERF